MQQAPLGICRDCFAETGACGRCPVCHSPRLARHAALDRLAIAHADCDAFYATIEKRDDPTLADRPVIVGGGRRGVVATACYVARTFGVRSAMPMFKALKLCPDAVVIPPRMEKYRKVADEIRALMGELTPLVEPLSIDEAFLDLTGTERLHGQSPARTLMRFQKRVEDELGVTVSIGLSANKFLAKIASDLDKPRGFAVLSPQDAPAFLAPYPISFIWGVGKISAGRFKRDGLETIGDLQRAGERELMRRYGEDGLRLARLSLGIDARKVEPERETKSVSVETTFDQDLAMESDLVPVLWELCEKLSARLKYKTLAGVTVTLKLKTDDFRLRTRSRRLSEPTRLAARLFAAGRDLLMPELDGTRYRLIGIGVSDLSDAALADQGDLADTQVKRLTAAENAVDAIRAKFGKKAVGRGISLSKQR